MDTRVFFLHIGKTVGNICLPNIHSPITIYVCIKCIYGHIYTPLF